MHPQHMLVAGFSLRTIEALATATGGVFGVDEDTPVSSSGRPTICACPAAIAEVERMDTEAPAPEAPPDVTSAAEAA